MSLTIEEKDDYIVMRLEGRVDATSAPLLEEKIDGFLKKEALRLLIDFTQVNYLSSAGLRFLLAATKRYHSSKGLLVLASIDDDVMEIIKMAGFEKILNIYPDQERAVAALRENA